MNIDNQQEVSVLTLIKQNYKNFGEYVNETRGNVKLDGLKAVQRRVLLSVKDCDKGKEIGSSEVVAYCLNNFHPHSDASIYDTLVRLVQKGFVISNANFGNIDSYDPSDPAHYRYTSIKSHKQLNDGVFKFTDQIEQVENEYGRMEPKTLAVPIPLALTTGATCIGFGSSASIPFFSAKSLFNTLHADDPTLLKAPNGIYIISGDIKKLWTTDQGMLQYGYKCFKQQSDLDGKEISIIEGPGRYFPTGVKNLFEELENDGSVYIRDESGKRTRVAISRSKNIKRITDEEVHKLALQASVSQRMFRIAIHDEGQTQPISIQKWMQKLWTQYDSTVENYKLDRVKKLERKIEILNLYPKVGPLVHKQIPADEIAKKLKLDIQTVNEILSKPTKTFYKTESSQEIYDLEKEIKNVKSLSAKALGQDVVNTLEKAQGV